MSLTDNGLELLSPEECHDLLARSGVGRVGVTIAALPAIFPVNYGLVGENIVFLTGEATKLRAAVDHAVVAFQVDQFELGAGWGWSVLAVGIATEISDPAELAAARTLGLRPLAQGVRTHFARIRPEFVSGGRLLLDPGHQAAPEAGRKGDFRPYPAGRSKRTILR
jgi:nitroimidazol reductase NimA-like FMN-containing flavoprotein (pyridoxamine 5'-phosphate oxidase superfamily)